jgi:hypothetical protein
MGPRLVSKLLGLGRGSRGMVRARRSEATTQ